MNNVHQGHKLRQHTSFLSVTEMSDVVDYPPPIIAALAKKVVIKIRRHAIGFSDST